MPGAYFDIQTVSNSTISTICSELILIFSLCVYVLAIFLPPKVFNSNEMELLTPQANLYERDFCGKKLLVDRN